MKKIAVFCGASSGFSPEYRHAATDLGKYLAANTITMVYGGGKIGIMGVIAEAMLAHRGEVMGVIPHFLKNEELAHEGISEMLVVQSMSERKVVISQLVDGYIGLAGGFGTLDEIFEALTLGQLNIEHKPIGLLNTNGFFDALLQQLDVMVREGFLKPENRNMLLVSENISDLIRQMQDYKAPLVNKFIDTVGS